MGGSLEISYSEKYTYYKGTKVITGIETSTMGQDGNMTVSKVNYSLVKKDGYYILEEKETVEQ
jgi:hypothetical protein